MRGLFPTVFLMLFTFIGCSCDDEDPVPIEEVKPCIIIDNQALHAYAWQLNFHDNNFSTSYNISNVSSICLAKAWESTKGVGVKVAIIDDSFEVTHEDFGANIINTYNVSSDSSDVGNKTRYNSHGTHTFSIMAALENDLGGVGIAPEAEYILIQPDFFDGALFDSEVIESFEHAKNQGAQVISNSWGSDDVSETLELEIKSIYDAGITVIFSVGNYGNDMDGSINDESELPWVIGVGASSEEALITTYSNYGSNMDVIAPGGQNIGILSADEEGSAGDNRSGELNGAINSNYHMFKGTSGAAPQVAGVAALILSEYPTLTPAQIRDIIIKSADKIGGVTYDANGFNRYYAHGKLNAQRALELAQTY